MKTTGGTDAKQKQAMVKPELGERQKRLEPFVGKWKAEGKTGTGDVMTGDLDFEWHTGGFFLEYRWRMKLGERLHDAMTIVGHDDEKQAWVGYFYDSLGFPRIYETKVEAGIIELAGAHERARLEVSADGNTLTIHWDHNPTGAWTTLCDVTASRVH